MRKPDDAFGSSDGGDEGGGEGAVVAPESLPFRDAARIDPAATDPPDRRRREGVLFLDRLRRGKDPWVQCLAIFFAASLTYSYHNAGAGANVQVAIMTVIALVGATPFASTHLVPASIGVFVGGQNIITSTGPIEDCSVVVASNYLWLLLLSLAVGLIWCFVIARLKILDGYAGRLGTTTFVGMNLAMVTAFGPAGVVDWDRYYYGFVHIVHVGEEDSSSSLATAWKWTEEAEVAIGYVLSVLWIGVGAGGTRILHNNYVQQMAGSPSNEQTPTPLNNVLAPVAMALLSMLVINATQYEHAPGLYNGFAVGAYVAMASLQKIPSFSKFSSVSLLAAGWGLALTPFFVGFAGKSGFTSMLGHVTQVALEKVFRRLQLKRRQRQDERRRQSEPSPPPQAEEGGVLHKATTTPTATVESSAGGGEFSEQTTHDPSQAAPPFVVRAAEERGRRVAALAGVAARF